MLKKIIIVALIVIAVLVGGKLLYENVLKPAPILGTVPKSDIELYGANDIYYKIRSYPGTTAFTILSSSSESDGGITVTLAAPSVDFASLSSKSSAFIQSRPTEIFSLTMDKAQREKYLPKGGNVLSGIALEVMQTVVQIKQSDTAILSKIGDGESAAASAIKNGEAVFAFSRTKIVGSSGEDAWTGKSELKRVLRIVNSENSSRIRDLFIPEMDMEEYLEMFDIATLEMIEGEEEPLVEIFEFAAPPAADEKMDDDGEAVPDTETETEGSDNESLSPEEPVDDENENSDEGDGEEGPDQTVDNPVSPASGISSDLKHGQTDIAILKVMMEERNVQINLGNSRPCGYSYCNISRAKIFGA
jgi:hypothetical protein